MAGEVLIFPTKRKTVLCDRLTSAPGSIESSPNSVRSQYSSSLAAAFLAKLQALQAQGPRPIELIERLMDGMLRGYGLAKVKVAAESQQREAAMAKRANLLTWQADRPTAGWNAWETGFSNPRVPSVPATLDL